jgi:DNA-binding winged helix-turn-helix (wHTH) protein/tetratricopeptide (TPR) repeat protein
MSAVKPLLVRFDAFELDESGVRLTRQGQPVSLPPKAFGVLCALARNPGQLMTKNALLDAVWGHQHVSESVLKTTISELRAALEDDAKQPRYIETASRHGYRFIGRDIAPLGTAVKPIHVPNSKMIGREAELVRLRHAWQTACNGRHQLVWVAGEAGVGKTTLIDRFAAEVDPRLTTYGQCVEQIGGGEPHLPVLQALKLLCRRDPQLAVMMRSIAPTWLLQLPWLLSESERAALHRELAGAHQDRKIRELQELMDRFTEKHPVLFVLEDLHWADSGTLQLMAHFARRRDPVRLLWLCSVRLAQAIAEAHPLRELRQDLRLPGLYEEIQLEAFSESEVAAYVEKRMPGSQAPPTFIRRLHAHTEGLPLFVGNVIDTFVAQTPSDAQAWLQGASDAPLPVPDNLAGAIEKQLDRLPADVQSLLEAASACGMEFRADTVADTIGKDGAWVREQCDALVKRQSFLRHVGIVDLTDGAFDTRYTFLHAIFRHVLYQRIALPQRVQLHRRAAQSLEARIAPGERVSASDLASHYEQGLQPAEALRHYAKAATTDILRFAPDAAVRVTEHALKLLERIPQGTQRLELELALVAARGVACAQVYGGGSPEAITAFERIRDLCDLLPQLPEHALLLNGLGLSLYVRGKYGEAREIGERVLALSERHCNPVLLVCAAALLGSIAAVLGKHAQARTWLEKGIAACEGIVEQFPPRAFVIDPLVLMHCNVSVPLLHLGLADDGQRHLDAAVERARQLGQPSSHMLTLWVAALHDVRRGDYDAAERHAVELRQLVDRTLLTQGYGPARWLLGYAQAQLGSPREGLKLILEGFECYARLGMLAASTETLGYAAEALVLAEDWNGAREQIDAALALAERLGERVEITNLRLLEARIALANGDRVRARSAVLEGLAEARAQATPFYETKALVALCELPDRTPKDLSALRDAVARFPQGKGIAFLDRAAALLGS